MMGQLSGLQIEIDLELCQGHGVCESEAAEVFLVNRDNKVELLNPLVDEQQRSAVELAVKYCPTRALRISQS
ncbi:MAG: ferredoxin [Microthrixaceae bacterium]